VQQPRRLSQVTARERDLVAEILNGRSNKEIAANFGLKEQTVRNQLTALYRKLDVSTRLELAVRVQMRDVGKVSQV